jgi:hypothetical protein
VTALGVAGDLEPMTLSSERVEILDAEGFKEGHGYDPQR